MGVSMTVYSEITGPVDDYTTELEGYRVIWSWSGDCYLVKRHPEIPDVGWTYGNLITAWDHVIANYPDYELIERQVGREGILFPDEVRLISEYLSTVEPREEHGEDFADRLKDLQELFGAAAQLEGGVIHNC